MAKICDMADVREYSESFPVEFWRNDDTGRLTIIARNQGGFDCTNIDFLDLMDWLQRGPQQKTFPHAYESMVLYIPDGTDSSRN